MGTNWTLKFRPPRAEIGPPLARRGESIMTEVDQMMSTFIPDNPLDRINRHPASESIHLDPWMYEILEESLLLHRETHGFFDITVLPLVELWGFGPSGPRGESLPTATEIEAARRVVGSEKLTLDPQSITLRKSLAGVRLDLSGIAQGFAVDKVADFLESSGVTHYYVEIGGEMRVLGTNPEGGSWTVAIESPERNSPYPKPIATLALSRGAINTSGTYRNFFEREGRYYSHTLNPKTGSPAETPTSLLSVTLVGPRCCRADGLATALLAMPMEEARRVMERFPDYRYFFVFPGGSERFKTEHSPGFPLF